MSKVITSINIPKQYGVSSYAAAILGALQGRVVYEGTANPKAVAKRRTRSRLARQSRKVNR
jgi:hypothetical protein